MHTARPLRSTRRLQNLAGGRSGLLPWYRITNQAEGLPTLVSIYDEIGMFGVPAGEFLADLAGVDGDIECHINSPGGDIFDGITIYNQLKARSGTIAMVVDGLAASAASFIAQAASPGKLEMAPRSKMMIHNGFGMAMGDASDMRKTADLLDELTQDIASIYAERSGRPVDFWLGKMGEETWYSDKQAVEMGLADKITGQEQRAEDRWDLTVFGGLAGQPANADTGWRKRGDDWVYDPDGDGDDDSTPEGDTDHDFWDEHGHQIKPIPPKPGGGNSALALPFRNADVDNSEWDGDAAMKAAGASGNPASAFKQICAGRRDGPPHECGSYALPHHKHPGSPPNAGGVRNALSRLPQTQGLTNAEAAKSHLEAHMHAINPDHETEDHMDPGLLQAVLRDALEGGQK